MSSSHLSWKDKADVFGQAAMVGLHVIGEHLYPRNAYKASDVPRSYREITPEWLTAVLCSAHPGSQVLAVDGTGGSVGTSSRHGLRLTLNAPAHATGLPERLFTKATTKYTQRLLLGLSKVIWGEVAFYNHLRAPLDIEAPKGYFACADAKSLRSMVLMEDIAHSKQARFISTETHITRPQIEALLGDMARYHAHYWADPALQRDFHWLPTPTERWRLVNKFIGMRERSQVGTQRAAAVIPPALMDQTDRLWQAVGLSLARNEQLPQTLLHGDSHVGQTYITGTGRMGLADWQAVMRGGWAFDVAYLMTSALTVEDRRAWEEGLIKHYLEQLLAAGGPAITFDDAWRQYRLHTFYPYVIWLYTIGYGPMQPAMQPDQVSLDIIERTGHAIHDLQALKLLSS